MSDSEQERYRGLLPTSFGRSTVQVDIPAQLERARRPTTTSDKKSEPRKQEPNSDDDDDDDDDDSSDSEDEFPVSHEIVIKSHERAVTSISLDASGSRLVTGSSDCTFKLHDFPAMTPTTIRSFRSVDPSETKRSATSETHPVHQVTFNPHASDEILVITASPQARIFSRDGDLLTEFVKGDMYLRDLHNTKGHTAEITGGAWHPTQREYCVTAGLDSTLRIWDVNVRYKQKDVIVFKSKAPGSAGRTRMTAVAWGKGPEGGQGLLVAAALDGTLVMYPGDGPYNRPAAEIRQAHTPNTWTSGLDISPDGRLVVTRGGDNLIKIWDTRKFTKPVNSVEHASTSEHYPTSNIVFSPSGGNVLTGSENGDLHILNPATLRPELVTPVTPGSALITVQWHPRLNQIITGSANNETHVLFNPSTSRDGGLGVMSRIPKRRHVDDDPNVTMDLSQGISSDMLILPGGAAAARLSGKGGSVGGLAGSMSLSHRHPTIGLTVSGKSRDPRRPHLPATTPFAKSEPDPDHVRVKDPLAAMRDEDPREALLKYAEEAKKNPIFTKAWKETQPTTLYAELSDEEEDDGRASKKTKR